MKNHCGPAVRFIYGCKSVRHSASFRVPFFLVERCVVMAYNILLEFADVTGSSRLAGSLFVR